MPRRQDSPPKAPKKPEVGIISTTLDLPEHFDPTGPHVELEPKDLPYSVPRARSAFLRQLEQLVPAALEELVGLPKWEEAEVKWVEAEQRWVRAEEEWAEAEEGFLQQWCQRWNLDVDWVRSTARSSAHRWQACPDEPRKFETRHILLFGTLQRTPTYARIDLGDPRLETQDIGIGQRRRAVHGQAPSCGTRFTSALAPSTWISWRRPTA